VRASIARLVDHLLHEFTGGHQFVIAPTAWPAGYPSRRGSMPVVFRRPEMERAFLM